jgi:hypothetical protein
MRQEVTPDAGQEPSYEMHLSALAGPKNADERDLVEWAGDYNPDHFDLNVINARLERMR